ncbi:hypothetical protein BC828DRAFT_403141 [Blastocladiella britannica]|nr:hypothetical protein BC828DRAFT_403141 [Blastocladiella britannica]
MPTLYPSYFITGASSGIGKALAIELATRASRRGTDIALVLVARRQSELEKTRDLIAAVNPAAKVHVHVLDINAPYETLLAAIEDSAVALGGVLLHCFVVNAGIAAPPRAVGSKTGSDLDRNVLMTNLVATTSMMDAAVHYIHAHKVNETKEQAHIVGVSSLAGSVPTPFQATYSASKAGLDMYLKTLSVETHGSGIHVTNIRPGFIDTPINEAMGDNRPFVIHVSKGASIVADRISSRASAPIVPRFPWAIVPWLVSLTPNWVMLKSAKSILPAASA